MTASAPPAGQVCRHLGLDADAAQHHAFASMDHRCHLWQMKDKIDLTHQATYCFTAAHRHCPWLSVPPAGHRPADRSVPKGKVAAGGGVLAAALAASVLVASGGTSALASLGHSLLGGEHPRTPVVLAAADTQVQQTDTAHVASANVAHVLPAGSLSPAVLTGNKPQDVSATLQAAAGGVVTAGNVGVSFSPKSLSEAGSDVTVKVASQPPAGLPGGPAQFSPDGSIVDISIQDASGKPVTTFPDTVDVMFKYNAADLAVAKGDAAALTAAYVIDGNSPELENPLHFPVGTWVFFPPSNMTRDDTMGTMTVHTQAIGSIFSIVAAPVSYAKTLRQVQLFSSFNPSNAQLFGTKPQNTTLQVVEPQIGSRVLTRDLDTGTYAYVEARDLGPVYTASH